MAEIGITVSAGSETRVLPSTFFSEWVSPKRQMRIWTLSASDSESRDLKKVHFQSWFVFSSSFLPIPNCFKSGEEDPLPIFRFS
jgi:hypothetical protein